ncbi:MAG: DUF4340 domain-containing protein [Acidobacteriota bacterium]
MRNAKTKLLILAAVLLVLFGLRFALSRKDVEVTEDPLTLGLQALMPEGFAAKQVNSIKIHGPEEDAEVLHLERDSKAKWTVTTAHAAQADVKKVRKILADLDDFQGEMRGRGDDMVEEAGLGEDQAVRLELGRIADMSTLTLLLGKRGDRSDAHFFRWPDSTDVYHVPGGVRDDFNLLAQKDRPEFDLLVRKDFFLKEKEDLLKVEAEFPDISMTFVPAPPRDTDTHLTPERWSVESPDPGFPMQDWGPAGVATRFARFRIEDVVEPGTPQCDLDLVQQWFTVHERSGATHRIGIGPERTDDDQIVVHLEGDDSCYSTTKWAARSALPRASQLWNLPTIIEDPPVLADVTEVTLTSPEGRMALRQEPPAEEGAEQEWTILSGGSGTADRVQAARMVNAVLALKWDDLVESAKLVDEDLKVTSTLVIDAGPRQLVVELLASRRGSASGQYYARIPDGVKLTEGFTGVLSETTVDAIRPAFDVLRGEPTAE